MSTSLDSNFKQVTRNRCGALTLFSEQLQQTVDVPANRPSVPWMSSATDDVHPLASAFADKLPANAPSSRLRPRPARINGIDLKTAEQLTRRLLLSPSTLPTYTALPSLPNLSPAQYRFLHLDGFASLAPSLDPASRGRTDKGKKPYGVPDGRASRKRLQVANLVAAVCALTAMRDSGGRKIKRRKGMPRLLDLCGGCGHVGLPLAALLPGWRIIVVDSNQVALQVAARRAEEAGLSNLDTLQKNVEQLDGIPFDVAVALHACGGASDTVLAAAAKAKAAVVVAPCCVGGVVATKGSVTGSASGAVVVDPASSDGNAINWDVPRSKLFRELLNDGEYPRLARAADFGEQLTEGDDWRRVAKALVEQDRASWMSEMGYQVRVVKMRPLDCTPKNDMLITWPKATEDITDRLDSRNELKWDLDTQANKFLEDVRDGSVIKGLGISEVVEVENILRTEISTEDSNGVYNFPAGLGKRRRKVVHAVAESMGLWHESAGKGAERYVSVRRTAWWPLFFDYFVGIGGPEIDKVCRFLRDKIPAHCAERRAHLRGNPHHVTVVRPQEVSRLHYSYKGDKTLLLRKAFNALKDSKMNVNGIGCVRLHGAASTGPTLTKENENNAKSDTAEAKSDAAEVKEAYFIVIDWPAASALRTELGLPRMDFHITLGFSVKDIHGVKKDSSTLLFNYQTHLSPWLT